MPVIEHDVEGETFELKNAPPDGFIKARSLSYDEVLTRRDLAAKFVYRQREANGTPATAEDLEMMMESANSAVQKFQFSKQIIDHNLTLANGTRFNFTDARHLKKLPSKLGSEIEEILDKLNEDEAADEEVFAGPSSTSSEESSEKNSSPA